MSIYDVLILLLMAVMAYRWARIGLVQGAFSLLGLLAGIIGGALLSPYITPHFAEPILKLCAVVLVMLGLSAAFGVVFDRLGLLLASKRDKHQLRTLDASLGAAFSVVLAVVYVWLFAAILSGSPFQNLNRTFEESRIVQSVNRAFPPAPAFLARIGGSISQLDFPQVFVGPGPAPVAPVAGADTVQVEKAVAAAKRSTVRIRSIGCGELSSGSGFVAAPGIVVTNAHVVAGGSAISVEDTNGKHRATVIGFDPDLDLAVLRTTGLAGPPLTIYNGVMPRGTTGAALGYPNGGAFQATSAAILRQINARGLNIYSQRNVTRQVYELQAQVISGDSGGPVVRPDGTVIGVIFARAENGQLVGYALTSASIQSTLQQAITRNQSVSTSQCLAE